MASESIHEKLQRVRRPHVNLTYPVKSEGTNEERHLPVVIGVMGDFSGDGIDELPSPKKRHFQQITRENFDEILRCMKAELNLAVANELGNDPDEYLCAALRFEKLADFSPIGIIRQVPALLALLETRHEFERIQNSHERLDRLLELDDRLSRQLRAILHHEKFRRLEGAWRGLHYLVENTEPATDLQIKLLCCTKQELCDDFEKSVEFIESLMFQYIIRDQLDRRGGDPYAVIVGDYEIENTSRDLEMLANIASVSAAAHCPFLTSPAASVFGMESWTPLPNSRDLSRMFTGPKYVKWNAARSSEDSEVVAMVMPRVLARSPYGDGSQKIEEFDFQEFKLDRDGCAEPRSDLCWSNAAYYLAACITRSYALTGFCTRIISKGNGGGKLDNLPGCDFRNADGQVEKNCSTEIYLLSDVNNSAQFLPAVGFIPMISCQKMNFTGFMSGDMLHKPKVYDRREANERAQASVWLPYVLASSRIAQYVKCYFRDGLSEISHDRKSLEAELNRWLSNYIHIAVDNYSDDFGDMERPLGEGKIELEEIPGEPHELVAQIWLRPWTMMRELTSPICVVTLLYDAGSA